MLPDLYEARHRSQETGFKGEDLAKRHCRLALTNSQAISGNSVIPLDSNRFHVASQTHPGRKYVVDTRVAICDCPDFPRIRFCKHLAAVQNKSLPPPQESEPNQIQSKNAFLDIPKGASTSLSGEETPRETQVWAATNVSEPGTQSGALPNRERLMRTCNLWKEMARNMHATRKSPKRRQPLAPDLPNSTTQHIGPIGKRKLIFTDPYSGGEQSGKRAKADALSASANARFRSLATSAGQNI